MTPDPFFPAQPFADRFPLRLFTKEDGELSCLQAAQGIGAADFATLNQVHGNRTIVVRGGFDRTEEADGMITDQTGLALIVRAADCQMFVVYDPEKNVIGTLHAGWRGLTGGAIPNFFSKMQSLWNTKTSSLYVFAGPSLCPDCAEFSRPHAELPNIDAKFIHDRHVDLRGEADRQLFEAGVLKNHFERHPDCTCCHPEKYWTWRGGDREAVKAGNVNLLACTLLPVLR
ncbi:MAG: polyphenol oxidase family protein [Candidatus Peribacteraceae bacterium]|nr:polyphenol oxidase family protein [Candidatus Peribacteraceae bacterium]MDD5074801.1 polyphenol oxidase family protein [Candidatus Peribacteraceae bacterium]